MRGKTAAICALSLILTGLLFIAACSDSSTAPSRPTGFSFSLTVVDEHGAPIEGLKVSRVCRIEYETPLLGWGQPLAIPAQGDAGMSADMGDPVSKQLILTNSVPGIDRADGNVLHPARPNPATDMASISMDNTIACDLNVFVRNWRGDEVGHFFASLDVNVNMVTLMYSFYSGAVPLPNGIFSCTFAATETGGSTVLFADSVYFSGYTAHDPYRQLIGYTDSDGSFSTKDKDYFPPLQGHQPQMGLDYMGGEQGLFSFSDTIDVKVMTELPPMTAGVIYWMTREAVVRDGRNEFEWVFVPDDSMLVMP